MKASLLALILSVFLGASAKAQQPSFPTAINARSVMSGMELKDLRAKADNGNIDAQFALGFRYATADGVPQNFKEAVKWYRKAADQGDVAAQFNLAICYDKGQGVPQSYAEGTKWYHQAAVRGDAESQYNLGVHYGQGRGVAQDYMEAGKWFRKAAVQGLAFAQYNLGDYYYRGTGVPQDYAEAASWYRKAADQGDALAQCNLGSCYVNGKGVVRDYVQAYKWNKLASAQGDEIAKQFLPELQQNLTPAQIAEGERLASEFKPSVAVEVQQPAPPPGTNPLTSTGFFVTDDGCLLTGYHIVQDAARIVIRTEAGTFAAAFVKADKVNDVALLKVTGKFPALPVASSRGVKLGESVFTIGFPNIELQGFAPN